MSDRTRPTLTDEDARELITSAIDQTVSYTHLTLPTKA